MYWFGNNVADLYDALNNGFNGLPALLPARAALLPSTANIIGVRLYQGGAGKGQSLAFAYPGSSGVGTDHPFLALLCKTGPTGLAVARRFVIHVVPDVFVQGGEFAPSGAYANAVATYFQALSNFVFRGIDPASPVAQIFNVAGNGLVTLTGAVNPFAVNSIVTLSKVLNNAQQFVTFKGLITAIGPLPNQFTVQNWTAGTCTGGTASQKAFGLWAMSQAQSKVARLVTRRIGRPFELYRGRRSKRRKVA
jgi:hypothetical protein